MAIDSVIWPSLPLVEWQDTHDTPHMWMTSASSNPAAARPYRFEKLPNPPL